MTLSTSKKQLRRLDLQSYSEKSLTWASDNPVPNGVRISNSRSFHPHRVVTDGQGNVNSMPHLAEKPCFGIPTAYLRHGRARATYVQRMKERVHNSRCDRCKIKKACLKLVKERLRAVANENAEFRELLKDWHAMGGFEDGGFAVALDRVKHGGWTRLAHFLHQADFTNCNDTVVRQHWAAKVASAQRNTETKARRALRKAWREEERLSELTEGLDAGFEERAALLHCALSREVRPPYLRLVDPGSVERICSVWWGREFARFTGRKINPNSIARCLIENRRDLGKSQSVLRDAVKTDLERIRKLEADAQYNGGTAIWPAFKHPALQNPLHFARF